MTIGTKYTFAQLERFLKAQLMKKGHTKFLKVYNLEVKQYAIMLVFHTNFSDAYRSGDGVLFYDDGETHSANPEDEFELLEMHTI